MGNYLPRKKKMIKFKSIKIIVVELKYYSYVCLVVYLFYLIYTYESTKYCL